MERILCHHDKPCYARAVCSGNSKTGKMFFVCNEKERCKFYHRKDNVPLQRCAIHDRYIDTFCFTIKDGKEMLSYHCCGASKSDWCIHVEVNKQENIIQEGCASENDSSFFTPMQSPVTPRVMKKPLAVVNDERERVHEDIKTGDKPTKPKLTLHTGGSSSKIEVIEIDLSDDDNDDPSPDEESDADCDDSRSSGGNNHEESIVEESLYISSEEQDDDENCEEEEAEDVKQGSEDGDTTDEDVHSLEESKDVNDSQLEEEQSDVSQMDQSTSSSVHDTSKCSTVNNDEIQSQSSDKIQYRDNNVRIFSNDMSTKCLPVVQCPLYTTFETASGHQDTDTSEDETQGQSSDKIQYRTKDNDTSDTSDTSEDEIHGQSSDKIQYRTKDNDTSDTSEDEIQGQSSDKIQYRTKDNDTDDTSEDEIQGQSSDKIQYRTKDNDTGDTSEDEIQGQSSDKIQYRTKDNDTSDTSEDEADVKSKEVSEEEEKPHFQVGFQFRKLVKQLYEQEILLQRFGPNLPDGGEAIKRNIKLIKERMIHLRGRVPSMSEIRQILSEPVHDTETETGEIRAKAIEKNLMIHAQSKMLTDTVVTNLHQCISTRPNDTVFEESPRNVKLKLMPHQKQGLAFFKWRETQIPSGGILADEMGLGKTLAMISLIVLKRQPTTTCSKEKRDGLLVSNGTLIVAPLTLLSMWKEEIETKLYPGTLSVLVYHGASRPKDPHKLLCYDVVITTYSIVGVEASSLSLTAKKRSSASNVLFDVHWNRIILDEGHTIRNPKSGMSIGCCELKADHRWILTGTPIHNKLKDFYSLIKFLRLSPFDDQRVWKDVIEQHSSAFGMKRLQTMVSSLVLRRTKEDLETIKLPDKTVVIHSVVLNPTEQSVYDVLFYISRGFFMKYLQRSGEAVNNDTGSQTLDDLYAKVPASLSKIVPLIVQSMIPSSDHRAAGRTILVILLRLRQVCDHIHLLSTALDSVFTDSDTDLNLAMSLLTLSAEESTQPSPVSFPKEFQENYVSSKIETVLNEVEAIISSDTPGSLPNKCIIVSQWTTMLGIIEHHLNLRGISHTKVDGSVKAQDRQRNVSIFNACSCNPRIMLLSLQAGGVGLTLTGANHLFIVDLHWNPQLEQQASDRCHRLGQERPVVIHRFCTEKTVESIIAQIQEAKLKLAADVLQGSKRASESSKLTLTDLKQIFQVN